MTFPSRFIAVSVRFRFGVRFGVRFRKVKYFFGLKSQDHKRDFFLLLLLLLLLFVHSFICFVCASVWQTRKIVIFKLSKLGLFVLLLLLLVLLLCCCCLLLLFICSHADAISRHFVAVALADRSQKSWHHQSIFLWPMLDLCSLIYFDRPQTCVGAVHSILLAVTISLPLSLSPARSLICYVMFILCGLAPVLPWLTD